MSHQTISITCKYRSGTYVTSKFNGQTASSTQGPEFAVRALAFKLLPDQKFTVVNTGKEYWEIHKIEEIEEHPKFQTIDFVDSGQDFTEWVIKNGVVIDSQPFQSMIWVGSEVRIEGKNIFVKRKNQNSFNPLAHRIEEVTETDTEYCNGYMDALAGKRNEDLYNFNQVYRWGFNVAETNKKGGLV